MKKLKKGIPFLIYMMIWSLYILFAWSRTHPGQIIEVSLFLNTHIPQVIVKIRNDSFNFLGIYV